MVRKFPPFRCERKKRSTSEGTPQFPNGISGKLPLVTIWLQTEISGFSRQMVSTPGVSRTFRKPKTGKWKAAEVWRVGGRSLASRAAQTVLGLVTRSSLRTRDKEKRVTSLITSAWEARPPMLDGAWLPERKQIRVSFPVSHFRFPSVRQPVQRRLWERDWNISGSLHHCCWWKWNWNRGREYDWINFLSAK